MQRFLILSVCCLAFANCVTVETATNKNAEANIQNKTEEIPLLMPVSPKTKLNRKQKKVLDDSLPLTVRAFLEKSEKFEILAEDENDRKDEGKTFKPTITALVTNENDKKEILEALYRDASAGESPAACYIPHHALRATHQGETIEIEICFECAQFYGKSSFAKFSGTIGRENRKSEDVFKRIVQKNGVKIQSE